MSSQSHLAGGPVHVDSRYLRQLCQWCGYRLVDMDLHNVAMPVETAMSATPAKFPWPEWEVGAWIRVDGPMSSVVEMGEGKMPPDSCMRDVSPLLKSVPTAGPRGTDTEDAHE